MYLQFHPYISRHKGRNILQMTDEAKLIRLKLLRTRAKIIQMVREKLINGLPETAVVTLIDRLDLLKPQIAAVGGIPKSWEKPLIEILGVEL